MTLPKTAKTVAKLAHKNGWSVAVHLSSGHNFPIKDYVALLFRRGEVQVGAFWHDGRYHAAVVHFPPMKLIQRDLKDLLATPVEEFGFDEWPPKIPDDPAENLRGEYEMCGYYISGHPLDHVNMATYPDVVDAVRITEEDSVFGIGERVQVLGIVEEPTVTKTRRNQTWIAFFGISDRTGLVRCFGFGEEYKQMDAGSLVHVKGVIDERNGDRQIKVRTAREISW